MNQPSPRTPKGLLADLKKIGEFLPHEPDDTETDEWHHWLALDEAYSRVAFALESLPSERGDIPNWEGRYKLLRRFLASGVDYAPSLLMQANEEGDFDRACDALLASEESANG